MEIGRVRPRISLADAGDLDEMRLPEATRAGMLSLLTMAPGLKVDDWNHSTQAKKPARHIRAEITRAPVTTYARRPATGVAFR